ncbi:hypothetical protein SAMN05428989_1980 [Pseudoxanthomonas sp. GM95]|uniref:hypothetical protein n=1 Tax=Pseudoxanthomonas sp. GM95 TaxID=1881043 RepID=UPI0008CFFD5B|nr:hypothetical protein [Pseudoxanthomonas sp. GM95]SEL58172.1 hypothetical protein SAMN05428989_1980 [Pseudoxanthomonas sp. GM95]
MTRSLHRIALDAGSGTELHDLLKLGSFEHWIVMGWQERGRYCIPEMAIRLEGLPYVPSGVGEADFTLMCRLPLARAEFHRASGMVVVESGETQSWRLRVLSALLTEHAAKHHPDPVALVSRPDGRHLMDPKVRPLRAVNRAVQTGDLDRTGPVAP